MKYHLKTFTATQSSSECLVIGIQGGKCNGQVIRQLDQQTGNYFSKAIRELLPQQASGKCILLQPIPHLKYKAVILINFDTKKSLSLRSFHSTLKNALTQVKTAGFKSMSLHVHEVETTDISPAQLINQALRQCEAALYQFDEYKTKKNKSQLKTITILCSTNATAALKKAFQAAVATTAGMTLTKNLANSPSNICTPTYLAKLAKKLSVEYSNIKTTIVDEAKMKKLGMGALLAVSQGSKEPAKLICMEYKGADKSQKPTVIVGKGVTFDTGGNNLKPFPGMVGMKYDMCGAATVFGAIKAAAQMKLKLNLVGVVSAVENMPGGSAYKPEDIITTMSGQTVEVLNTDAEGRLALCDALTYVKKFKPKAVIDMATLTGAMVIALGHLTSGLFSNHQPLADKLIKAGQIAGDKVWQLPIFDEYQSMLDSPFADMANIGGSPAGSITAACFLSRFTKEYHWAHIDIAGTSFGGSMHNRYATARPLPMLMEYLINQA